MDARIRVALLADPLEEGWTSMDLVADMLMDALRKRHSERFDVTLIRPVMSHTFRTLLGETPRAFSADRLVTRFVSYPRLVRKAVRACGFDVYHIIDHSYSQLALDLPTDRTVVTCHDIDAFRVLCDPEAQDGSHVHRWMASRQLRGLRSVARVICDSDATRRELMHYSLSADHTLATIPLGVDPSCSEVALENETVDLEGYLGLPIAGSTLLLHVGSTIPRKRMDTLLRVFARTREDWPSVRLVQAGGTLTVQQAALAEELGVLPYISQMPFLPRPVLAALYRNCAAVLQTSSHEGFGLPVAEAMACGAVVIASDIPVLREVGGESVVFCPVADVGAWSGAVNSILHERESSLHRYQARRLAASQHATRFSWSAVADTVGDIYTDLHAFAREK